MTRLAYKEDTGAHDVQPGEVWSASLVLPGGELQPIAYLACGDLLAGALRAARVVAGDPSIALLYSDPPWGQGNAQTFMTKAGYQRKADFGGITRQVALLCRQARHYVVEMGQRWEDEVALELGLSTSRDVHRASGTYYRRHAMTYLSSSLDLSRLLEGRDDEQAPSLVIPRATASGEWVTDPCTGRGLTAVSAVREGRRFVGCELHPRRAAITLQKLERLAGIVVGRCA